MTARKKPPVGQSIGGVLFGFEQQVFRNQPPPHELVHRARPDSPVAAGDGSLLTFELSDDDDRRTTMTDAQIRELTTQPTVAVRIRQPRAATDMAQLFGQYLPLIGGRLASTGVEITGAPFGRYHLWGPDQVDVEIGIPVAAPPAGLRTLDAVDPGEPGTSTLPGGPAAVTIHTGPYAGLPAAYSALHDWIYAQGRDEGNGPWEAYVDDPEGMDPATVRTEIVWPVR